MKKFAAAMLAASALGLSGCAYVAGHTPGFIADYIPGAPEAKVQGMVERAARLHIERGAEAALSAVQDSGDYLDGEYYVFVLDVDKYTIVANPAFPEIVGQKLAGVKTPDGSGLNHLVDDATPGGAWVRWPFYNPVTKAPQQKHGWLVKVGNRVYGSGVYLNDK